MSRKQRLSGEVAPRTWTPRLHNPSAAPWAHDLHPSSNQPYQRHLSLFGANTVHAILLTIFFTTCPRLAFFLEVSAFLFRQFLPIIFSVRHFLKGQWSGTDSPHGNSAVTWLDSLSFVLHLSRLTLLRNLCLERTALDCRCCRARALESTLATWELSAYFSTSFNLDTHSAPTRFASQ